MNARLPIPPPVRIVVDAPGYSGVCDICGSSLKRRWFGLGAVIGCLQPRCWNWHGWSRLPPGRKRPIDLYGAPKRPTAPPSPPNIATTEGATTMQTNFNLGDKVRDKYTGFEGWVHGTAFYITGCDQCLINQRALDEKGQPKDGVWLDNTRLEVVASEPVVTTTRGGPSAGEAAGLRSA